MLGTFLKCWCPTLSLKRRPCWWQFVTDKNPNRSLPSQTCQKYISTLKTISGINAPVVNFVGLMIFYCSALGSTYHSSWSVRVKRLRTNSHRAVRGSLVRVIIINFLDSNRDSKIKSKNGFWCRSELYFVASRIALSRFFKSWVQVKKLKRFW